MYSTANDLKNGITISDSRKAGIYKKIIYYATEMLGVNGTIILGIIMLSLLIFLINRKIKNPKKGEIIKLKKNVFLNV